mgnify:CR=1 FL=1
METSLKQEHRWTTSVLSGLHAKPFLFFPPTEVATCSTRLPIFSRTIKIYTSKTSLIDININHNPLRKMTLLLVLHQENPKHTLLNRLVWFHARVFLHAVLGSPLSTRGFRLTTEQAVVAQLGTRCHIFLFLPFLCRSTGLGVLSASIRFCRGDWSWTSRRHWTRGMALLLYAELLPVQMVQALVQIYRRIWVVEICAIPCFEQLGPDTWHHFCCCDSKLWCFACSNFMKSRLCFLTRFYKLR